MSDKTYVVAGNNTEFFEYLKSKRRCQDYVNVSSIDGIRGLHNINVKFIGSYEERKDIRDIMIQLAFINHSMYQQIALNQSKSYTLCIKDNEVVRVTSSGEVLIGLDKNWEERVPWMVNRLF